MDAEAIVHIVDDDDAVRDSLRFLLETEGYVVRTYSGAEALLEADLPLAGCVMIDFQMPGMDGLQLQAALAERGVRLAVVVMSAFGEIPLAVRAMRGGAVDFLEKPFENQHVLDAVGRALAKNRGALQAAAQTANAARRISALTPREREVLHLLVAGKSNKEIARELGTSPRTIDVHRARVFRKLDADNLPELVQLVLAARIS
jgi:two-component system response regulator FixJ